MQLVSKGLTPEAKDVCFWQIFLRIAALGQWVKP